MTLQRNLNTRRQFLELSMWGLGGLAMSSSLLQSCKKDHNANPNNPTKPGAPLPSLGDADPDYNEEAKMVVVTGLSLIPVVGEILGPLTDLLWPTGGGVWGQIAGQVEALINQKISANVLLQVNDDLQGLNQSLILYFNEVKNGAPSDILGQWRDTRNSFVTAQPHFQSDGYQVLLLPLFAQFNNLYLSLLRDAAISGKDWGMTDGDFQQVKLDLTTMIQNSSTYSTQYFQSGLAAVKKSAPVGAPACEPFNTVNKYNRQMTLSVLDYFDTWSSYDITTYPNGNTVVLTREIYSDAYGSCMYSGDLVMATPPPTKFPTNVTVWSGENVGSVQLTYPAGSGPAGATVTPRMGIPSGSNEHPIAIAADNPIISARVYSDVWVGSVQFLFNDGTASDVFGNTYGFSHYDDSGWLSYTHQVISSMHINGIFSDDTITGCADSIVFGFMHWITSAATLKAVSAIYVKSPKELSMASVAKAFPKLAVSDASITSDLKSARQAYWDSIKARAAKIK
jgi:hypothetical protein